MFTANERLILTNQYEILKYLDSENETTYQNNIEILTNGYEIYYTLLNDSLFEKPMAESEGRLVLDILTIYRLIINYKLENPDDEEVANHYYTDFMGFDGNNETNYLFFTMFLVEDMNKFIEQKANKNYIHHQFNTHSHILDKYHRMVNLWKGNNHQTDTHDQVLAILDA